MEERTIKPFARALGDLLRERSKDPLGRVSLRPFLETVKGHSYSSLRMMISGERKLTVEAIEAIAEALGVQPEYFREYRLYQLTQCLLRHPELIDRVYDICVAYMDAVDETARDFHLKQKEASHARSGEASGAAGKEERKSQERSEQH